MSLIQVDGLTVTSATASVVLGEITDDSVYLLTVVGAEMANQNDDIYLRVGTSASSADQTANYDYAALSAYSGSEINNGSQNDTSWQTNFINAHASGWGTFNGWIWLHGWYNSGENSVINYMHANLYTGGAHVYGSSGAGVHTVDQSNTHVHLVGSGNIVKGDFGLYKLVET